MLHTIAFKGPLGLFACALIASFAAHAQEALEGRPAAIAVNSATVQGQQSVDPIQRTWRERITPVAIHHSLVNGAATNTLHWWSGELTANYLAMQVALDFNTERKAGVAFFIVF